MTKDTNILIRIDPKQKTKAQKAAFRAGLSLSDWIRKLIEEKTSSNT